MDTNTLRMIQKGESVFQNGRNIDALELFNSVLEKDPENIFALNDKGVVLNSIGRYNDAINTFLHILNIDTNNSNAAFNLISNYFKIGKWDEANEVFEQHRHILKKEDAEKIEHDLKTVVSNQDILESSLVDPLIHIQFQEKLNRLADKRLFFIMGVPKSGTTWTQYLLDAHPQLWCSGEGDLNKLMGLSHHLIEDYNNHVIEKNRHIGTTNYTLFKKEDLNFLLITAFTLLMSNGGISSDVNCIGMKYPALTKSIHIFGRLFPNAKFIHIIREGRDVLVSAWFNYLRRDEEATRKLWPTFKHFVDYGAKEWVTEVKKARSIGQSFPNRYFEFHYENLHKDPDPVIKKLLDFLGVDSSTSMVEKCREAGSFTRLSAGRKRGQEDRNTFFRKGIVGDWKNHFDDESLAVFMQYGGDLLTELGYEG